MTYSSGRRIKQLDKSRYTELLRGHRDPKSVPTWQLVRAFEVLRNTYHVVNQLKLDADVKVDIQFMWERFMSVIWLANHLVSQEHKERKP